MKGIEILASNDVVVETVFNWKMFWGFFGMVFIFIMLIGVLFTIAESDTDNLIISAILGFIFSIILGYIAGKTNGIPKYATEYKITISDEVSIKEFNQKYEIIEQDEKIYTVREKK